MNKFSALLLCGLLAACSGGVDSDKAATESNESKPDMSQRETVFLSADTIFDESLDNPFAVTEKFKGKTIKTTFLLNGIDQLPSGKPRLSGKYTGTKAAGIQSGNLPSMFTIMDSSDGIAQLKTDNFIDVFCTDIDNSDVSSRYVIVFKGCKLAE